MAKSVAEKLQLANEIATLMIEVARKAQLQEAAAIRLAQITSSYDFASRPTSDWGIDAQPTTEPLATTGGTGLQPNSPDTPPVLPPPNLNDPKVLAVVTALTTVFGVAAVKLSGLSLQQLEAYLEVEVQRRLNDPLPNLEPEKLQIDLDEARQVGIEPMKISDSRLPNMIQSEDGRVKWAVDVNGDLWVVPYSWQQIEIKHSVLTGGNPVIAAGEAELSYVDGKIVLIDINSNSGHYRPPTGRTEIGRKAFIRDGVLVLQ